MRYLKPRFLAVYASVMAFCLSAVSFAAAEGTGPDYSKLTEGITGELDTIVPVVLVALGVVMGITFAVKWAMKRFGGAR